MFFSIVINLPGINAFGVHDKQVKNLVDQADSGIICMSACMAQAMHLTGNYDR